MWFPFQSFPRELGFPQRSYIVHNMQEFLEKINLYNGKSTIFTSLYSFDETKNNRGVYSSARINQIYFDTDCPNSLLNIRRLHSYCLEKKYLHAIFFSGRRGFHFYIATTYPNNLKNKKGAVMNSQIFIADEVHLKIGINDDSDIDGHIIGNIAQLVRVPNTFHIKGGRYCIPLLEKDLDLTIEEIKKKAEKQQFGIPVYGEKFFDLTPFDSEPRTQNYDLDLGLEKDLNNSINENNIIIEKMPSCIQNLLKEKKIKHRHRFYLIMYFKEMGLSLGEVIYLLKKYLEPQVFYHCVKEEQQPRWIYKRTDLMFPRCEIIQKDNLCTIRCKKDEKTQL